MRVLLRREVWDRSHASLHILKAIDEIGDGVPATIHEGLTGMSRKGELSYEINIISGYLALGEIKGHLDGGGLLDESRKISDILLGHLDAGDSERCRVAEKDFCKALCDDRTEAIAIEGLGCMLARATTAEVRSGNQDRCSVESRVIKRVKTTSCLLSSLGIGESKLTESIEGNALHEACGNNAVGVDIVAGDKDAAAGDLGNFFEGHEFGSLELGDREWGLVNAKDLAGVADLACQGGGSNHERAHEHGTSCRTTLAPLEITVAGAGAELVSDKFVWIHAEAHGAPCTTPLEAGLTENFRDTHFLRNRSDSL